MSPAAASPIVDATPKSKFIVNGKYFLGAWSANVRVTRYGATELTVADPDTGAAPYHTNRIKPTAIADLELGYDLAGSIIDGSGEPF